MNVSDCHSVTHIPNLNGANRLRELKLHRCDELVSVDESVGFLSNLAYLSASECSKLRFFLRNIYLPSLEHLSFSLCNNLECFPEIDKEMGKPLKIYLMDTSIELLPHSVGNLVGLEYVDMTCCYKLQYLPSSLFMLPNLVTLKVGGCSQLQESIRRPQVSNSLKTLHHGFAGLLDEDLHMIIHNFPKLEDLNLTSNHFVSFPTRIQESTCLTSLDVSCCAKLKEIPELPPSVKKVNARECSSLNAETLAMLWFQVRKEIKRLQVIMPSTEIPKWFHHRNEGGIPVFKARGKFPVVAVAFVLEFEKVNNAEVGLERPKSFDAVDLQLFIEGEYIHCKQFRTFFVADKHVLLLDLRVLFSDKEWEGLDALLDPHYWKTVHLAFDTRHLMTLRSWGVYVYKQETNMDNIQFLTPSTSPYCYDHQPSYRKDIERGQGDITRSMLEDMVVPEMFEEHLMVQKNLKKRFNESLITSLAKVSRKVVALREAKGSRFILQQEDDNYGHCMERMVEETMEKESYHIQRLFQETMFKRNDDEWQTVVEAMMKKYKEGDHFSRSTVESTILRWCQKLITLFGRFESQTEGNDTQFNLDDKDHEEADSLFNDGVADSILKIWKEEEEKEKQRRREELGDQSYSYYVPQYDEEAIIIPRQLYNDLIQGNKEVISWSWGIVSSQHVANVVGASYEPGNGEEGIIMDRQLFNELVRANMTMASTSQDHDVNIVGPSYHDVPQDRDQGLLPTATSESSGQGSQEEEEEDDDDDVIKVQYYIFDFTKQQ
ncbi:hypothetical protein RIF29_26443 [Crotalaria pallida]|uniref:Disease resistance protein RPS4B/Roq1-like leucine-rich repeats domain-containing protein n=1 Tax=Crotalaria pallida TaxID=3830 RepID=A0AAN9EV23_CROPI